VDMLESFEALRGFAALRGLKLYEGSMLCKGSLLDEVNLCEGLKLNEGMGSIFARAEVQPGPRGFEADQVLRGKALQSSARRSPARLPNFLEQAALDLIEVLQCTKLCGFFFDWGIMCMAIGAAITGLLRVDLEEEMEMNPVNMKGLFFLEMETRMFARGHAEKKVSRACDD
ncbi:hypothetical protein L7F22_025969, partial [Adiantum nelumboides]|nr:hypothetical protein [Adiantum nelumboides]